MKNEELFKPVRKSSVMTSFFIREKQSVHV